MKKHIFPPFKRSAHIETHRNQSGAIDAHYNNRKIDDTVPLPKQPADRNNPNIKIATNAHYRATEVVKFFRGHGDLACEWCHVQADSLGGLNCRQNLFAGSTSCNTFMLALEDIVRENDDIEVSVATFYQPKWNNGTVDALRTSSRLAPAYVSYGLKKGKQTISYLISARTASFSAGDRAAVFKAVKAALKGVKIPKD